MKKYKSDYAVISWKVGSVKLVQMKEELLKA